MAPGPAVPAPLRPLFDRPGLAAAHLDRALRVSAATADFTDHFGLARDAAAGRPLPALLHPDDHPALLRAFTALRERSGFTLPVHVQRPDGRTRAARLTALHLPDGALVVLDAHDPAPPATDPTRVTPVEAQVLEGLAAGLSTVALGTRLHLSRGGVIYHLSNLQRKFHVHNRPALIAKAYAAGLLLVDSWPPAVLPNRIC
ncbi:hypothetical protein BJP25_18120 [Actinokineospora bangkokensis]|uniref:HTH luxR-type domain-containing protein n=1 Tax=Actinokineospora bangkokensis TaxID=1193682 RepID=A0A1Q9LM44_9PSEU|nr:hypothetical protein BJP25_18120 [Actinokineospora bangkokensis]